MAFVEKWTYDARQGACVEHLYGGCYATKNLFDNLEDCQAKCANPRTRPQTGKTVEVCGLAIDKGPCKKFQLKFGFNRETNRCEKFVFGGKLIRYQGRKGGVGHYTLTPGATSWGFNEVSSYF